MPLTVCAPPATQMRNFWTNLTSASTTEDANAFTYLMKCKQLSTTTAGTCGRGVANRLQLASIVGSLQFCAILVHGVSSPFLGC
mmetsp:Transcript_41636/g.102597  ORF Transcript_41636/g.102597 Transcript_41636/m.102597 type:complete len:84 (-) Transcript_41636:168-419(-)